VIISVAVRVFRVDVGVRKRGDRSYQVAADAENLETGFAVAAEGEA
jgi:hypothetical protein